MRWLITMASTVGHVAALVGLDRLPTPAIPAEPAAVTLVDLAIPEPSQVVAPPLLPEPEPEPEPPAALEPPMPLARDVTAPAATPPPPSPAPAQQSLDALPDLGLVLSGGSAGLGMAVAQGSARPAAVATRSRVLSAPVAAQNAGPSVSCSDGPAPKPRLSKFRKPIYTQSARTAAVSGKVRVSITVGPSGGVEQVTVLIGLGHGLDEATVAAVRAASFEPARRCGRAERSTFTMSVLFSSE